MNDSVQLNFISDQLLEEFTQKLLDKAQSAADRAGVSLYRNVVDPFSATFDAMRQGVSLEQWLEQEKSRQVQKSLQNFVGDFHQSVLGAVTGWEDLKVGNSIDLRNRDKKIIAEIKNKFNTMNSLNTLATYDKLQKHLDYDESYKGFIAYCVVIIPRNAQPLNKTYHPAERGTARSIREDIRIIDGKSFYELVTGDPDGLQKLYNRLPIIISKITKTDPDNILSSEVFIDLFKRAYTLNS